MSVVGKNCTQIENEQLYTWRETIQKHRIHKIENKHTKQKHNQRINLKKIKKVIRK